MMDQSVFKNGVREGPPGAADPLELAGVIRDSIMAAILTYAKQHPDLTARDLLTVQEVLLTDGQKQLHALLSRADEEPGG
jgi:hypothetical protein